MQTFKRFGLYVLSIALVVTLVSAAFIIPWLHTPTDYHDQALREKLAGQIDTLIIGQSYAMDGVMPQKLDEALGTVTYNLSGSLMPVYGQAYMVKKELARNPIKHVIIEITPDTFTSDECAVYGLLGQTETIDESLMGFNPQKAKDVSLSMEAAPGLHQAMSIFNAPLEANIREYEALIELCQQSGCEVTIIYTPVSHAKVWQLYDQDTFREWAQALADKYGVPLFDFNLLKDRYALFDDTCSYSDDNHLSREGAEVFSAVMADVLRRYRAGEDVSPLFYSSYREVIRDSVYWGR